MASKGKNKPSIHDLGRVMPHKDDLAKWERELSEGSERACALVGAALLDLYLEKMILTRFIKLSEPEQAALFSEPRAILGSLSGRIDLAHALGLIGPIMRDDLDRIRRIRNAFAHSALPLEFENPLVKKETDALSIPTVEGSRDRFRATVVYFVHTISEYMVAHWERVVGDIEAQLGKHGIEDAG